MTPEAVDLAAWRALALDPPRAGGPPPAAGTIRAETADFVVEERLGFGPDGGGAHRLLWVEKQDANTLFVARELAAKLGCAAADVGFAGLKDRRAVARQWFSTPAPSDGSTLDGFTGTGFRVLSSHPHSRKLRRGALASNRFTLRVRELTGDTAALEARIAEVGSAGFPNYFGAQRFGREGVNLARVRQWLADGRLPRARDGRGFLLSSARALAFNAVLAERVRAGSWNRLLPGEIVNLAGSASVFPIDNPDALLESRCHDGDIGPTGPLCGEGGMQPAADAGAAELPALLGLAPLPERLGGAGVRAKRRALVARPAGLQYRLAPDLLDLQFELPRGVFATSFLREVVQASVPDIDADADAD
jgi:tRNA pseudouridine13 synthase